MSFKRIFRSFVFAAASILACFAAVSANAGALTNEIKTAAGVPINVSHIGYFGGGNGTLYIKYASGWTATYADPSNVAYTAIKARPDFSTRFISAPSFTTVPGAFLNVDATATVGCTGGQSSVVWQWAGSESFNDGCALSNAVANAAN